MGTARRIASNTLWQIAGKAVTAVMSIIIIKLLTVYLGRAGFGAYTTVYEYLAFFGIAADFGLFQIAVREMSKHPERKAEIFGNILSLRIILTGIAMAAAAISVWFIPAYQSTLIPAGVLIGTVTTYATLMHGTLSAALQAELKIEKAVIAQVIGKVAALGYMLWAMFVSFPQDVTTGFYHLLAAGIVGNVLMLGLTYLFTRRIVPVRLQFDFAYWRNVVAKALPYGSAIILATIYFRIDVILLSILRGPEEVGIYGVAMRILENLQMIPVFFMNAALPVITTLIASKSTKLRSVLQHSFDFLIMAGLPMVVGGVVLAYPIIAVVSSPEFVSDLSAGFYGSDIALQILFFAMFCAFLGNLFNYTLLAGNQQMKVLYVAATAAAANIITNLLIIPHYGFRGAALTSVASELFVMLAGGYLVAQMTGISFRLKTAGKALLAAGTMGTVVWYLQPIAYSYMQNASLALLIPLGGAVYVSILFVTQAVTKEHLALLRKKS